MWKPDHRLAAADQGQQTSWSTRWVSCWTLSFIPQHSGPRDAFHLVRRAPRLFPFIERIFLTADTRDARLAMTVWAHWCLELANRQAIGRCSI